MFLIVILISSRTLDSATVKEEGFVFNSEEGLFMNSKEGSRTAFGGFDVLTDDIFAENDDICFFEDVTEGRFLADMLVTGSKRASLRFEGTSREPSLVFGVQRLLPIVNNLEQFLN